MQTRIAVIVTLASVGRRLLRGEGGLAPLSSPSGDGGVGRDRFGSAHRVAPPADCQARAHGFGATARHRREG